MAALFEARDLRQIEDAWTLHESERRISPWRTGEPLPKGGPDLDGPFAIAEAWCALDRLAARTPWLTRVFPMLRVSDIDEFAAVIREAGRAFVSLDAGEIAGLHASGHEESEEAWLAGLLGMFDESPEPLPAQDDPSPSLDDPEFPAVRGRAHVHPCLTYEHQERLKAQGLPGWDRYGMLAYYEGTGMPHHEEPFQAFFGRWDATIEARLREAFVRLPLG